VPRSWLLPIFGIIVVLYLLGTWLAPRYMPGCEREVGKPPAIPTCSFYEDD
jgi:hypothetical protein